MKKLLIIENCGWEEGRAQDVRKKLAFLTFNINKILKFKNPIIVNLYKDTSEDDLRAEYTEGVINIFENCPDWMGDFLHELAHQLCRWEKLSLATRMKIQRIQRTLKKNKGDGRIFLKEHTWKEEKEVLATIFKWYMLGKVINDGYLEVLRNYQPLAITIMDKIITKEKLEKSIDFMKSKRLPIGTVKDWKGKKFKKIQEGRWQEVKKQNEYERNVDEAKKWGKEERRLKKELKEKQKQLKSNVESKKKIGETVDRLIKEKHIEVQKKLDEKIRKIKERSKKRKEKISTAKEFVDNINFDNVKNISLNKLKPTISKPNLELLIRFKEGIKKPIIINKNTNMIEDGNHRYFGAMKYGLKEVPVIFIDDIPMHLNKKVLKLISIENKLQKSKYNKIYSDKKNLLKARREPIGTTKNWKGGKFKKVAKGKWQLVVEKKEKKLIVKKESRVEKITREMPEKGLNKGIDFKANEKFLNDEIEGVKITYNDEIILSRVKEIIKENPGKYDVLKDKDFFAVKEEAKKTLYKKYESFTQNLTPVHSLDVNKFLRVLKSGGLKSLEELGESGKNAGYAIIESEIRPKYGNEVSELIYGRLKVSSGEISSDSYSDLMDDILLNIKKKQKVTSEVVNNISKLMGEIQSNILKEQVGAVAYEVDKEIGTNKHIFSIMGPNGNGSGYGEISIVMKQEVMDHPDFNMTPTAGTSFYSREMEKHRTWVKPKDWKKTERELRNEEDDLIIRISEIAENLKTTEEEQKESKEKNKRLKEIKESLKVEGGGENQINHFNKSKLNRKENPDYHKYMAKDIAAQGSIDDYLTRQSHGKWEGHLPSFVPMDMIQEVIIPEGQYKLLKEKYYNKEMKSKIIEKFDSKGNIISTQRIKIDALPDIPELNGIIIKQVKLQNEILPYMNKGFKKGKWNK